MLIGAHKYQKHRDSGDAIGTAKRRLWWSIVLRDRIMPLALRRTPQINYSNFDLDLDSLNQFDLQSDIECLGVYDRSTKLMLLKVLQAQCQLALVLTRVLMICYNFGLFAEPKSLTEQQFLQEISEINLAKADLERWSESSRHIISSELDGDDQHLSVRLYTELVYIYSK